VRTKTTLILPDHLMRELKRRAADRGETLSAVVEATLQRGLMERAEVGDLPALPTHPMGRSSVDVADRDRLYEVLEAP
jgi:hypothetical protein